MGSDVVRRLTAVLAADVAGYSRLMAEDEIGTLNCFRSLRSDIIDPLIGRHRGDIVGSAGDSVLVAFASAIDAVACALAWQQGCGDAAAGSPADRRMLFRIGIHLGDVISDAGTIHGDGVNIAARLEKLAQPGGLVVSRAIREQVEGRLELAFADLGPQELKNIARPVEAFEIVHGEMARASPGTRAAAAGERSDGKISIAVLPFANMSGDQEQDYFSDGITEDIITDISRFRELRVIARNSSFAFRGQSIDIAEVARKLGVQFVVEGSVRKAGSRLRITAQLIEAGSDRHVWAERYDRDIDDIFAVQDEIARNVAALCAGHAKTTAAARTRTRPTESLSAYDLVLRARALFGYYAEYDQIEDILTRAMALDPDYAVAHAQMANVLNVRSMYDGDMARRERGADFARRAIKLDPEEPLAHCTLGFCLTFLRRMPEAGVHYERATELNPNDAVVAMHHGLWLCYMGRLDQALVRMREGLKCDPFAHDWFWDVYSLALMVAGKYGEALAAFERMMTPAPWSFVYAAIAQVNLGNMAGARALLARSRQSNPNLEPEDYVRIDPYVDPAVPERLIADIRKALEN